MSQETLVDVSIREMKLFIYTHCLLSEISEEFGGIMYIHKLRVCVLKGFKVGVRTQYLVI